MVLRFQRTIHIALTHWSHLISSHLVSLNWLGFLSSYLRVHVGLDEVTEHCESSFAFTKRLSALLTINRIVYQRYWNSLVAYPMCRSVCPKSVLQKPSPKCQWSMEAWEHGDKPAWRLINNQLTTGVAAWQHGSSIRMPFGVVSGVGRGMGLLDGVW